MCTDMDDVGYSEIALARHQAAKWEALFDLACRDRDSWQQQCERLEKIADHQRKEIRRLTTYERLMVIDVDISEAELAEESLGPGGIIYLPEVPVSQETQPETEGSSQATRNEGQDSEETSGSRV